MRAAARTGLSVQRAGRSSTQAPSIFMFQMATTSHPGQETRSSTSQKLQNLVIARQQDRQHFVLQVELPSGFVIRSFRELSTRRTGNGGRVETSWCRIRQHVVGHTDSLWSQPSFALLILRSVRRSTLIEAEASDHERLYLPGEQVACRSTSCPQVCVYCTLLVLYACA